MISVRSLIFALALSIFPILAFSTIINVPDDQPTIQAGIDSAFAGDTVLIRPGMYADSGNDSLTTNGKDILIRGEIGADSTIIGRFYFAPFDVPTFRMEGLTTSIVGAFYEAEVDSDSLIIDSCIISTIEWPFVTAKIKISNSQIEYYYQQGFYGKVKDYPKGFTDTTIEFHNCEINGGVSISSHVDWRYCVYDSCTFEYCDSVYQGSGTITNSTIRNNTEVFNCGNLDLIRIENSQIYDNSSIGYILGGGDYGTGAIHFYNCIIRNNNGGIKGDRHVELWMHNCVYLENSLPVEINCIPYDGYQIIGCSFIGNDSDAIIIDENSNPAGIQIENNILAFNNSAGIRSILVTPDTVDYLLCNDIYMNSIGDYIGFPDQTGINNNMSVDPFFCHPDTGNYSLYDISPCAPENNTCSTLIGALGVDCYNIVPEITSLDTVEIFEDSLLVYQVTFDDVDGPDTLITFENIPSWLTSEADSIYGTPTEGMMDSSFSVIVSDDYKADTLSVFIDIIPVNDPPVFSPVSVISAREGDTLILIITTDDPEDTIPVISAESLPIGASFTDSANGTGLFYWEIGYDQANIYFVRFIASDGILTDSIMVEIQVEDVPPPDIATLHIDGTETTDHVINHTPLFEWDYLDISGRYGQVWYEIEIDTNIDWSSIGIWNPDPAETSDTFVVYDGEPLYDSVTYYLRLRVSNGYQWSEWHETSFRMNSIPTIPILLNPINNQVVDNGQPVLWVENSNDYEGDTITYDYIIVVDTTFGEPDPIIIENYPEGSDSTGWQVPEPLHENWRYWWQARAFDGYEYSDWSELFRGEVWINAVEEAPSEFILQYPPDTGYSYVFNMLETFYWLPSVDPDPFDSVDYALYISKDSGFEYIKTIENIQLNEYTLTTDDSLEYGTQFWWQVTAVDNIGDSTYSTNIADFKTWMLGDADSNWTVNILDITYLIEYLYKSGPAPYPLFFGDVNANCIINILDITYLISYLYKDGPAPMEGCE